MNQRFTLLLSIFLAVFVLVIAAGVAGYVTGGRSASAAPAASAGTVPAAQPVSPDLQKQITDREAAYADLLNQANERIQQLSDQVQALQTPTAVPVKAPVVSASEAVRLALKAAGRDENPQKMPELVSFEGKAAYEVKLKDGAVYINSATGDVLFNGVPARIDAQKAGQIAGKYLGGMDPRWATIKTETINGVKMFKVVFNGYTVWVDDVGQVLDEFGQAVAILDDGMQQGVDVGHEFLLAEA